LQKEAAVSSLITEIKHVSFHNIHSEHLSEEFPASVLATNVPKVFETISGAPHSAILALPCLGVCAWLRPERLLQPALSASKTWMQLTA
jgi:hypothetical protein